MVRPELVTNLTADDQLLYFTSTSLLKKEEKLIFIRTQNGNPNLFSRDLISGHERQLTHNKDGYLKSYVYFDGHENTGFGKASVSLDPERGIVYYIQGSKICSVDQSGKGKTLNTIPTDQVTAFTHVSADGSKLCVPTTDARALDYDFLKNGRPVYDIDRRVREEKLNSYLRIYCTDTGEEIITEKVPEAWITHVQFSPIDSNKILYNHEWPSDCGIRRVWLWNGQQHLQLRTESEERTRDDWTCHEMWQSDGKSVIYHGSYNDSGICYIGRVDVESGDIVEVSLPESYKKYGHFTVANTQNDLLVSDGYFHTNAEQDNNNHGGAWISTQSVDWKNKKIEWVPLCKHGSNWDSQDSHPHPIYDHDDSYIYFTSNKEGLRGIYRVKANT
ncbi:oligogalacturonate lyase family protein [Aquibacillus albus]|uniref:Tol biopolymer transport system component n=1 Tax=Aquibacillus albus TaxID=1168171 RepID=A0ABS2MWU3_9BACI|nr:oligogalacturonate lyase family protein [Aquibacillus albus]MBM7570373.1 Tol biopolymer transport system component [Aquibacillus albus]